MGSKKLGKTKRQHYVPRMILRNFSDDGKRTSLIVNGQCIDDVSIKEQCQEPYLYGSDNIMEDLFAAEESKMSTFFGDLAPERFSSLDIEAIGNLLRFVWWQRARTKGAAEHLNNSESALFKAVLKNNPSFTSKFSPEDIDSVEIGFTNSQGDALWQAAKLCLIITDMSIKFITTDRTLGFVISDNPVVEYNQFAEHLPNLRDYPVGLVHKGLQFFMPLSPSMTLALFDPSTYEYGGKTSVCKAGPEDVKYLNRMQAANTLRCLYYHKNRWTIRLSKNYVPWCRLARPSTRRESCSGLFRAMVVSLSCC